MTYWKIPLGLLLAIGMPVVIFGYFYDFGRPVPAMFGPEQTAGDGSTIVSPYWAGLVMFIGTIFGAGYEHLRNATGEIRIGQFFGSIFRQPGTLRALIASPLLFSGVYITTRTASDPVMALAFAFQSGFFCEALLRKKSGALMASEPQNK